MSINWGTLFDTFGVKRVTTTDKRKSAYVPNAAQRQAIESAGIRPSRGNPFVVQVLFDRTVRSVESSYYYAERSKDAGRSPEARMGFEFISSWLNAGDDVVIGSLGDQLFAAKTNSVAGTQESAVQTLLQRVDHKTIIARALKARGKPARKTVLREDFVRNPYVVRAAILRSKNRCEMPGCKHPLFQREDGVIYLEVHHIIPLAEMGDDTLANAAALCPHCHRLLHYGKDRLLARKSLSSHIATLISPKEGLSRKASTPLVDA